MKEGVAIGIRLDRTMLNKIEQLMEEEHFDRSTTMRVLLEEGFENHAKRKAAEQYIAGQLTLSAAAKKAGVTMWEMEQFLVQKGFKSAYGLQDLKNELKLIR